MSCEELDIDESSPFEADPSLQIPKVTNIHYESINGSSVSFGWEGNDFAMEFSSKLEAVNLFGLNETANLLVDQPYYDWGDWSTWPYADFNNLDEGDYTFYVKSLFDSIEEEEPYQSLSFTIDNISGPALRIYPMHQTVQRGEATDIYLFFDDVDTAFSFNVLQLDIHFSGNYGSNANTTVELFFIKPGCP